MTTAPVKKVLLLGSGMCSPPFVHYLDAHGIECLVASRTVAKTEKVIAGLKHAKAVSLDIESKDALADLDKLTQQVDLVMSLLPYIHHVAAAKIALKHKKHFCTTSYVSDEMATLDEEAKKAGVIMLNECGVDPGLDHMSAKKIIDDVHEKKGKIIGFYSICGGLPAPQDNNNPFGYKLSWSPRGVLLAGRNNATFLEHGKKVEVLGKQLYDEKVFRIDTVGDHQYEWYPNRDSIKYKDIYSIPEAETIVRGTYRNLGWCRTMRTIAALNLNSTDETKIAGKSYADFILSHLGKTEGDAKALLAQSAKLEEKDEVIAKLEWLGLFSKELKVPEKINTPLDAVCNLWELKMQYGPGEKDMIVMKHTFEIEYSLAQRESWTSVLLDYGLQPKGHSSMSRTVSLPVAVAVRAVLEGRLKLTGLVRPVIPEVYNLILKEMAELSPPVKFVETKLGPLVWVRAETKPGEERVALVPEDAAKLLKAGFRVVVEKSPHRCIPDEQYAKVGCPIVEAGSWVSAPTDAIILGVKELPESDTPLRHRHSFFAHCYKYQGGWKEVLQRFVKGGGLLWDLEFLNDASGRRVAAFGRPAGLVGMAVGLLAWAHQKAGVETKELKSWKTTEDLVKDVRAALAKVADGKHGAGGKALPSVLVLGALGRCGNGAVWFAEQCGITPTKWDLAETKVGGPFPQLLDQDVLVNAIYLSGKIPPFVTDKEIAEAKDKRQLSMFVDVSCDTSNPANPFPIYKDGTTLFKPVLRIRQPEGGARPLDVIAIDHLPSLVPLESSLGFSHDLTPHLLNLVDVSDPVWFGAEKLFHSKVAELGGAAAPKAECKC